jgi:small subunit ribosomal protein S16
MGRKKAPHYRVVVADSRSPRDGRFVETLGYYKPLSTPARLVLDLERVEYWMSEGADPSHTVRTLISKARAGGDDDFAIGEPDSQAEKEAKQEALAAKRAAEKKEREEAEAAAKAEAEAAAQAEAEAAAAEKAAEAESGDDAGEPSAEGDEDEDGEEKSE